jgi:predicted RNase H-like HicB family nuclease
MRFRVRIVKQENGDFVADCDTAPGCTGEGATREQAVDSMKLALKGHMAQLKKKKAASAATVAAKKK